MIIKPSVLGNFMMHKISIVIPVFDAEKYLRELIEEIKPFTKTNLTPSGKKYVISEVILVNDCGSSLSAAIINSIEMEHSFVKSIWFSKNFGQHPATLAGMGSSSGDWIATLDEDGEHNPSEIANLLDTAILNKSQLVYASPTNSKRHGMARDILSSATKMIAKNFLGLNEVQNFQSFRLMLGSIGRSAAAYSGSGSFLDVSLSWLVSGSSTCQVVYRIGKKESAYSTRNLFAHFWRLLLSSGTRVLRVITVTGVFLSFIGVVSAFYIVFLKLNSGNLPQGWVSLIVVQLFFGGVILAFLGVIAEFVGITVNAAIGKPLFVVTDNPDNGPLGVAWDLNE